MKKNVIKGRNKRSKRVRSKISGNSQRPRLLVFRSSRYIYAQIINDEKGKTLVSADERQLDLSKEKKLTKSEKANHLGELLAAKAKKMKISKIVFDRNGYKYHGRVKSFAQGARKGGLVF